MPTEFRHTREEDFDNALPALLPAPLGENAFLHYSPPQGLPAPLGEGPGVG